MEAIGLHGINARMKSRTVMKRTMITTRGGVMIFYMFASGWIWTLWIRLAHLGELAVSKEVCLKSDMCAHLDLRRD